MKFCYRFHRVFSLLFYQQLYYIGCRSLFCHWYFCWLVSSILLLLSMLSGATILKKPWSKLGIQKPQGGPKNHRNNSQINYNLLVSNVSKYSLITEISVHDFFSPWNHPKTIDFLMIFEEIKVMFLNFNFIEIALRHGCSPANLLHIFRTPFPKNTSE